MKKIKLWLLRAFFKNEVSPLESVANTYRNLSRDLSIKLNEAVSRAATLAAELKSVENSRTSYKSDCKKWRDIAVQKESMADLMRDNLGLIRADFTNVNDTGYPSHILDTEDKLMRDHRIAQLSSVHTNETFQMLCEYLINCQGNFSLIKSKNFDEDLAGRFSINGISLVMKELKRANALYEEAARPPDSFDEHDIIHKPNL